MASCSLFPGALQEAGWKALRVAMIDLGWGIKDATSQRCFLLAQPRPERGNVHFRITLDHFMFFNGSQTSLMTSWCFADKRICPVFTWRHGMGCIQLCP